MISSVLLKLNFIKMEETKNQLIQTGFTLDRLHQDGKIDAEAYTILKDRNKQAINYSQCCTEFICHSCNEKKSGQNDDQLHEVCKDCFSGI